MLSALKALEGTTLISATDSSVNTTALTCSTLHCTNWTFQACNENVCGDYNKTTHTPACANNYCEYLAPTVEYTFYYFDSKIINATIKMHFSKIPMYMPLLMQNIIVKWYLGNESIDSIVRLSGNPGYITGLPIIVSYAADNHTRNFYNQTYVGQSVLPFPRNVNGQCTWSGVEKKTLMFGVNTRLKCRLSLKRDVSVKNGTRACHAMQATIEGSLRLNHTIFMSPYGRPGDSDDDKWIPLQMKNDRTLLYGDYRAKNSKLICYNLVTRYEFVIAYADTSEAGNRVENKMVKATVGGTYFNVTLDWPHWSTVLTVDVRFIDISKPLVEFAAAPNLNIRLPTNFFLDYPSNKCIHTSVKMALLLHCYVLLLVIK